MAGGRDLQPRAPRWLDWLLCSTGIASAACLVWRLLVPDSDAAYPGLTPNTLLPRLLSVAVLPVLLVVTFLAKAARRLAE
jgi:hypothetical protein